MPLFLKYIKIKNIVFLASNLFNIGAMQYNNGKQISFTNEKQISFTNEEVITLEVFYNCKNEKTLKECLNKIYSISRYHIPQFSLDKIKTFEEIDGIIRKNTKKILFPITLGNNARKEAYDLSIKLLKYLKKYNNKFKNSKISDYRTLKLKEEKDDSDKKKLKELDRLFCHAINKFKFENKNSLIYKINKHFDFSNLLCVSEKEKCCDKLVSNIGRDLLNGITQHIYKHKFSGKDKLFSEVKRARNGEMNCTINSTLLYTFLKLNNFECFLSEYKGHEFVLINYKDEIREKIVFADINLCELETIDDMYFYFNDIIRNDVGDKIWDGMFHKSTSNRCVKDFKYKSYTPTYVYYKAFIENFNNVQDYLYYDIKLVQYYLNGLKSAVNYLTEKGHTNGKDEWKIRFSPRKGNKCKFILNLDDLGEPNIVEFKGKYWNIQLLLFKSKKDDNKYINYMKTNIMLPYDWRKYLMDGKIKIGEPNLETKKVEYRILNKENEVVEKGISEIHGLTMDEILNTVGIK